ncbi:MAG: exodeoxyribonuclease V subunit gamma [Desulfobacteraceae bacterium]|nr:exodeoxyribonuclease V subunit gamma [Desulfobacteraceae bacterium]
MPNGLHIITSNQMEILAAGLAKLLSNSPDRLSHALRPETVLVQSKGMQRWVSMAIAKTNGICANLNFPFPNAFLETLYRNVIGPLPEPDPFELQTLAFHIFHLLPELSQQEVFAPLWRYLATDSSQLKRYQLAVKVADLFDQYAVFRPELLLNWQAGRSQVLPLPSAGDAAWQAALWRRLVDDLEVPHRSAWQHDLVELLADSRQIIPNENLPNRLMVFGISHLPPFHLQVLNALSHRIPVYLFLLNPCRHYWFDILSDHQMTRARAVFDRKGLENGPLHLERGNRLLASLGHLGKQFFDLIHQNPFVVTEAFVDAPPESLLGWIQHDILELVDRPEAGNETSAPEPSADGSLRIHCCHSPMREVEVLYDQILDMLALNEGLEPRDILVMTPNINMYAPYIQAVFGAAGDRQVTIPYTVADRALLSQGQAVESFMHLFDLVGGRFEVSRVLSILQCPAVHQQFGLTATDMAIVEKWLRSVGIHWGWDGADRKQHHLPGFKENTWRQGIDRLILGFAMAADNKRLFSDILPFDGIGAGEGAVLASMITFAQTLYDALGTLAGEDSPMGWSHRLNLLVDRFFLNDSQSEQEITHLRRSIHLLAHVDACGQMNMRLSFEVVRQYLKDNLSRISLDSGFMAGGVTFCAMLPMRSIPAQVICLLGMNHDAFPREQHEPGFNLITAEPRIGDRSKRNDDRYLFLEALLSARKIFYLSYVGRDIQDNSAIAPSVVVDELIEYLSTGFSIPSERLVAIHPLHGFSPNYFDGGTPLLFSYSRENREAAEKLLNSGAIGKNHLFFNAPLAQPDGQWRKCQLEDIPSFFSNPCQFLLENRLGLRLKDNTGVIADRETFVLDNLQRYQMNQQLLSAYVHHQPENQIYSAIRAGGNLPHGTVGKVSFGELSAGVQKYISNLRHFIGQNESGTVTTEIELAPFFIQGTIDGIYPSALIKWRLGKWRPKDLIQAFVHHLALQISTVPDRPQQCMLICQNEIWQFEISEEPEAILKSYLQLYWEGLQRPLFFFSRSSFEYARQILKLGRSAKEALSAARSVWKGNEFDPAARPESIDPYILRCFGEMDRFTSDFEQLALAVYAPILTSAHPIQISLPVNDLSTGCGEAPQCLD